MKRRVAFVPAAPTLALLVTGCAATAPKQTSTTAANPLPPGFHDVLPGDFDGRDEDLDSPPVLTAIRVPQLPLLDGSSDDEEWDHAPVLQVAGTRWRAVYTKEHLAILLQWLDRDLKMTSTGAWEWDPAVRFWTELGTDRQEWLNIAWDISSSMKDDGCDSFCHEYPVGSGDWHHQTERVGEYVDSWMIFGKHGFSEPKVDLGWFLGEVGVREEEELIFETTNDADPRNILAGDVTFLGYAEDDVIAAAGDPKFAKRNRPRDYYCEGCHVELEVETAPLSLNFTHPDEGEIKYSGNWNEEHTGPLYMETAPGTFSDSLILTQEELANDEAVAVSTLSEQQVSEYWSRYAAVNGVVPALVLKEPTGSMADVVVAANWIDGKWNVEIARRLVTGHDDDVQFSDLEKPYPFCVSISNFGYLLGRKLWKKPGLLRFDPADRDVERSLYWDKPRPSRKRFHIVPRDED